MWVYTKGIITINGQNTIYLKKGQYCDIGGLYKITRTMSKDEVLLKAYEHFLPLAVKDTAPKWMMMGDIFLN